MLDTMEDGFIMNTKYSRDTAAYIKGWQAYFEPCTPCPYESYTDSYHEWWLGYEDAWSRDRAEY